MSPRVVAARDRRALLAGAVVIAGLLIGLRGVPAWVAWRTEMAASAAELAAELHRSQALLAAFPASVDTLEARLGRLRSLGVTPVSVEDGTKWKEALRGMIELAARRAGAQLDSQEYQVLSKGPDTVQRIRADLRGAGDVESLALLLAALEGRPGLLRIVELSVRPGDVHAPPEQPEYLELHLAVEAIAVRREERHESGPDTVSP